MLDGIIRAPIFYQISVFGIQVAIILYQIEIVSIFHWISDSRAKAKIKLINKPFSINRFVQDISHFSFNLETGISELIFLSIINYVLCYIVTISSSNTMSIGYLIYGLYWYQLPRGEQFIVQMIIQRTQKPFELKGLGVVACSLETYMTVKASIFRTSYWYLINFANFVF